MTGQNEVNLDALRVLIVLVSVGLIAGSVYSADMFAAKMFGILGGIFLPLVALLYEVSR